MAEFLLRAASKEDMPQVWTMVQELDSFAKMPDPTLVSVDRLTEVTFGPNAIVKCFVAEQTSQNGDNLVGYACCNLGYSCRRGNLMFLKDLYVKEVFRGKGLGKKLFGCVAKEAADRNCVRVDWHTGDWNVNAIKMYDSLGATNVTKKYGWQYYKLEPVPFYPLG